MRHTHTLYLTLLIGGLLPWACDDGEGATPLDAMTQDTRLPDAAAPLPDAAAPLPDAAAPLPDAAAPLPDAAPDAAAPDAGAALEGFGLIWGQCGLITASALTAPQPAYLANHIDFGDDPYDDADAPQLTEGGREIIADGNAGGSSILSEVFSYEVLHRCEGATLLKTEMEVRYQGDGGKITDLLVEIDGHKVGVSVTRAVGWPRDDPYPVAQATALLEGKLSDVLASSARVAPEDAWRKQILHVLAYADQHQEALRAAYEGLDPAIKADTILLITITDGDDGFIY